jgi:hypothetical protein
MISDSANIYHSQLYKNVNSGHYRTNLLLEGTFRKEIQSYCLLVNGHLNTATPTSDP